MSAKTSISSFIAEEHTTRVHQSVSADGRVYSAATVLGLGACEGSSQEGEDGGELHGVLLS